MSKITKAWIEAQIENELDRGNHPDAVRDLAALITVKKWMLDDPPAEYEREVKEAHTGEQHHHGNVLTKDEAEEWVEGMKNTDPDHPTGEKWTMEQIKPIATKHGFTSPDKQIEFWAVMNMMYSDYCETAKKHGVSTMDFYADMAKAWMHDKDAVENKTAAYIEYCTK